MAGDTGECLSLEQVAALLPSTPTDHPLCPGAADADADADDGASPDVEADVVDVRDETAAEDVVEATADDGSPDDGGTDEVGPPIEIIVFAGEEVRMGVGFPVPQPWESVRLEYDVRTGCPTLCDAQARVTTVTMDLDGGTTVELFRGETPFGGDASWVEDITDLAPLLRMTHRITLFIDTTVGAWVADLRFVFTPGTPPRTVQSAIVLWDEPTVLAATTIPERLVTIPPGLSGASLVYRLSGYATSGTGCDETCARTATVSIDGLPRLEFSPWRTDCGTFTAANPLGDPAVVALDRSGWCPADRVQTVVSDVGAWLAPGDHTVGLQIPEIDAATGTWRAGAVLVLYR
jgi:hypothetical protein